MFDSDPNLERLRQEIREIGQRVETLVGQRDEASAEWTRLMGLHLDYLGSFAHLLIDHIESGGEGVPEREAAFDAKWETLQEKDRVFELRLSGANRELEAKKEALTTEVEKLEQVKGELRQYIIETYGEEYLPPEERA